MQSVVDSMAGNKKFNPILCWKYTPVTALGAQAVKISENLPPHALIAVRSFLFVIHSFVSFRFSDFQDG